MIFNKENKTKRVLSTWYEIKEKGPKTKLKPLLNVFLKEYSDLITQDMFLMLHTFLNLKPETLIVFHDKLSIMEGMLINWSLVL